MTNTIGICDLWPHLEYISAGSFAVQYKVHLPLLLSTQVLIRALNCVWSTLIATNRYWCCSPCSGQSSSASASVKTLLPRLWAPTASARAPSYTTTSQSGHQQPCRAACNSRLTKLLAKPHEGILTHTYTPCALSDDCEMLLVLTTPHYALTGRSTYLAKLVLHPCQHMPNMVHCVYSPFHITPITSKCPHDDQLYNVMGPR